MSQQKFGTHLEKRVIQISESSNHDTKTRSSKIAKNKDLQVFIENLKIKNKIFFYLLEWCIRTPDFQ